MKIYFFGGGGGGGARGQGQTMRIMRDVEVTNGPTTDSYCNYEKKRRQRRIIVHC